MRRLPRFLAALKSWVEPRLNWLLPLLLILCVARLWLMPLPSSFWVDEMVTIFVVRHGGADPSLRIAPQVPESIYYWLPWASEKILLSSRGATEPVPVGRSDASTPGAAAPGLGLHIGSSELVYRLPSILAMGLAVFLIARLAARLIHPQAAWFTVFACLALRGMNYYAD